MLERMDEFFDTRLDIYDEHQLSAIDSAREFYPFTAQQLPVQAGARVLDLGCGTGLELEAYFALNPSARVLGIDLAPGMLELLCDKFPDKDIETICGSYFDAPFGTRCFDAAVSVESLHHFTMREKIPLYRRVRDALVAGGYFVLTDYFAATDKEERRRRAELLELKREQNIADDAFYHYDTPLTVEHEVQALTQAGFTAVEILASWGQTATIRATA